VMRRSFLFKNRLRNAVQNAARTGIWDRMDCDCQEGIESATYLDAVDRAWETTCDDVVELLEEMAGMRMQ